jgi:hypothetical protein
MNTLSSNFKVQDRFKEMVESGKEFSKKNHPAVDDQIERTGALLERVVREKAVHDQKKYERIRNSFLQNYKKIHPLNKSI